MGKRPFQTLSGGRGVHLLLLIDRQLVFEGILPRQHAMWVATINVFWLCRALFVLQYRIQPVCCPDEHQAKREHDGIPPAEAGATIVMVQSLHVNKASPVAWCSSGVGATAS